MNKNDPFMNKKDWEPVPCKNPILMETIEKTACSIAKIIENVFYIIVFVLLLFFLQEFTSGRYEDLRKDHGARINNNEIDISEMKLNIEALQREH